MGRIKHDAIVLTGQTALIAPVHSMAVAHFDGSAVNVSNITEYGINDTSSFLIAPDGSKEGWPPSDEGDRLRESFVGWLQVEGPLINWIEVRFGGDEPDMAWVRLPAGREFQRIGEEMEG